MNTIFNNIMSQVYEIKNFFKESFRKSIIDEFDLLDIKVFKLYKESDMESSISKLLNMSNRTEQQNRSSKKSQSKDYSLRQIMIMDQAELEKLIFCFNYQNQYLKRFNFLIKQMIKGLHYMNFVEEKSLPTF